MSGSAMRPGLCLLALSALSTGACFASKTDVDQLRNDLSNVRAETAALDSVRAMQMVQVLSTLRSVSDTLSSLTTRLTHVRAESQSGIREIHDQVMQVQEATGQSQQRLQEMRAAMERRDRAAAAPAPQVMPASGAAATPDTAIQTSAGPGPNELFQMGRTQLARGANSAARAAFADLLARYPDSDLAADAQFYLAESLAAEGKTSAADSAYATVVSKYQSSLRAATALYKRGVAQQKAGKTTTAKRTFNDVVRRFPDSDEAALARERLRAMS